jgi:mutator protein MutT
MAAVIRRGDTLLICQRPAHTRHGGRWEFPGGKCEPGESDAESIARELAEELGVGVRSVGSALFSASDPDSPFVIVFVPVEIDGEPQRIEHDEIRWVRVADLANYSLAPSDASFVRQLPLVQ